MSFEESEILTNEYHQGLLKGCPSQEGKWRLLFRASRDGFAAAAFHSRCDNKGPTVTIVKSGNNTFGGFTEVPWTNSGKFPDFKIASAPFKEFWAQFDEEQYILFKITQSLSYLATLDELQASCHARGCSEDAECAVRRAEDKKKRN